MEELQKEVNEYRRREQHQASAESRDGSIGGSEGDTINVNANGEKVTFRTECVIDPGVDIKSLPSAGSNTPPPSNINSANLSSNNSIKSRSSPEDVEKEQSGDRNSNGFTMDIDTHEGSPPLIGSVPREPSSRNIALQQTHAVVQPQRLTQPQHQRTHIPQQFPFTAFGLAAPALPPTYNLAADWPWPNTPSLYRDPMNHQAIPGKES